MASKEETKSFVVGFAVVVGIVALGVVMYALTLGIRYFLAEPTGKVQMEESMTSGNAQIYSYNHFFDMCAAVQGYEQTLKVQQAMLADATDDKARIRSNIAAISGARSSLIAQYNADAGKIKTMARFKDDNLPNHLSESENTVCAQ